MARKPACPQCGAGNPPDARRCRLCATLLNPEVPEEAHRPKGIPEHVQRQMERDWKGDPAMAQETVIPGGSFGSLPPIDAEGPPAAVPPAPVDHGPGVGAPVVAEPAGPVDDDHFDPDELFRQMHSDPTPMTRVPFGSTPDLEPDPLWSLGGTDQELSSEEISRLTAEALREERLRKRPGLLDKVFRTDADGDVTAEGAEPHLPPPPAAAAPLPPPPAAAPPPPPPPPPTAPLPPPPSAAAPPPPAAPLPPPPIAAPPPPPPPPPTVPGADLPPAAIDQLPPPPPPENDRGSSDPSTAPGATPF